MIGELLKFWQRTVDGDREDFVLHTIGELFNTAQILKNDISKKIDSLLQMLYWLYIKCLHIR